MNECKMNVRTWTNEKRESANSQKNKIDFCSRCALKPIFLFQTDNIMYDDKSFCSVVHNML